MSDGGTKTIPAFKRCEYPQATEDTEQIGTIRCLDILDNSIHELEGDHAIPMRDRLLLLSHTRMLRGLIAKISVLSER